MTKKYKYPRTPHLPNSLGFTPDDIVGGNFVFDEVVVSHKLDGESTGIGADYTHARSLDSRHHPSRAWVKALQSAIGYQIPSGCRLYGENMFAMHQIYYRELKTYFFLYGIYDENNVCLSWEDTKYYADAMGLTTVPVFYEGKYDLAKIHAAWLESKPFPTFSKKSLEINNPVFPVDFEPVMSEGYVVRAKGAFRYENFATHVAKYVRKEFKDRLEQTDEHWASKPVYPNSLT